MENGKSLFFSLASPALLIRAFEAHALALTLLRPFSKPIWGKKTRLFCSLIIMQIEENVITASEISIILHIIIQKLINFIIIIFIINIIIIYNSLKIFLDKLTSSLTLSSKTLAYFFTRFSDMHGCFFFSFFFSSFSS